MLWHRFPCTQTNLEFETCQLYTDLHVLKLLRKLNLNSNRNSNVRNLKRSKSSHSVISTTNKCQKLSNLEQFEVLLTY